MKIVLIYDQLNTGGTERLFITIANLLHHHGHDVKVVIIKKPATLDDEINQSIPIIYLHRRHKLSILKMKQLVDACKKADIIHLHSYYNWRYFYISSILFRGGDARMILHEHSDMKRVNNFDKFILPNLDAFIAVHPMQASDAELAGLQRKKIFLLPNIVETNYKLLPNYEKKNRLLMVGNIRREKYYELALDIIRKLPQHLSLDIYGNISDEEYYKELRLWIDRYNLGERVRFFQGETDIVRHFPKYDLAIHTANNETGPLVILEYLSAHLPFFSSSAGQSPAIIAPILPHLVMSSYNAGVWAEKINWFYGLSKEEHYSFVREMEAASKQILNTESYYNSLVNIYQQSQRA